MIAESCPRPKSQENDDAQLSQHARENDVPFWHLILVRKQPLSRRKGHGYIKNSAQQFDYETLKQNKVHTLLRPHLRNVNGRLRDK